MDWGDFSAAYGTLLPGLAILTVTMVFGIVAAVGRLVALLRSRLR